MLNRMLQILRTTGSQALQALPLRSLTRCTGLHIKHPHVKTTAVHTAHHLLEDLRCSDDSTFHVVILQHMATLAAALQVVFA